LFFICNGITALREAFLSACEAAAKPAQVLQPVGGEPTARAAWLLETLAGLPLPCAIFAGHDRHAVEVIAAAAEIGLEVPKQVAVLGVGNDGRYLQRSRIALSSVDLQRSPARLVARHSTETYVCEVPGVAKAVLKIRNRYSEPLTVPAMARECGMSVRNLYRLYRATTGNTIGKDLMARRMEAAAELLRDPKLKLEPIALETGLGSAKNLCRLFKDYFGQTPGQWRETWRTSGCE
jgi:LacI family transcriptional regulator